MTGFIRVTTPDGPALLRVEDIGHVMPVGEGGTMPPTVRSVVYERRSRRDVPLCFMVCETIEQIQALLLSESEHGRTVQLVLKAATMLGDDPNREPRPDWLYELHGGGKYWLDTFGGQWKEVDEATFLKRVDVRAARLILWERT